MTLEEIKKILDPDVFVDGGLFSLGWYIGWSFGNDEAVLDGEFTADELIAIGNYMKLERK